MTKKIVKIAVVTFLWSSLLSAYGNLEPNFLSSSMYTEALCISCGYEFLKFVNPFYGTERGGNKFPGVLYPFGMVKIGGDFRHATNYLKSDSYAGYQKHGYLRQVSLLHVSGTGGSPTYGVVGQLPLLLDKDTDLNQYNIGIGIKRKTPDSAHLGYYKIDLYNNVNVEFTAGRRSAIIKYNLTKLTKNQYFHVLVNTTECLNSFNRPWWSQKVSNSKLMVNKDIKSYNGFIEVTNGWSSKDSFRVYFYAEFDNKFEKIAAYSNDLLDNIEQTFASAIFFQFDPKVTTLMSKIGVSYNSIEQARINLYNDFGDDFDFERQVLNVVDTWKSEVFDQVVEIEDEDLIVLEKFYNSLYGSHLMPTEKSGVESPYYLTPSFFNNDKTIQQYLSFNQSLNTISDMNKNTGIQQVGLEPVCSNLKIPDEKTAYYDDWFTLWDTYRTLHPLLFIIQPEKSKDMVNTLALISEYEGFAPDGRSGGRSGRTQGGSNSDMVISESLRKNIVTSNLERCRLYKTSWRNANVLPPYFYDRSAKDSTNKYGRGALMDWVSLNYVSTDFSRSLTRTVEYSNNDFSLAMISSQLGDNPMFTREYLRRSRNWINLWNDKLNLKAYDYTGFLNPKIGLQTRGKYKSKTLGVDSESIFRRRQKFGSFLKRYNPADCGGCYWGDHTYEGTSIEYMFSMNHDISKLISILDGGADEFEQRLDDLYNLYCNEEQAKLSGLKYKFKSVSGKNCGFADVANEPSFGAGYLYNYINNHDKTAETLTFLTTVEFGVGTQGIPGNSDSGAMESWLWFGLIGFYPVSGTDIYLIGTPQIKTLNIRNKLLIKVHNLDPDRLNKNVRKNIYIEKVLLNGIVLQRNWLKHGELFSEKNDTINILEFYMLNAPVHWDALFQPPPTYEELLYVK